MLCLANTNLKRQAKAEAEKNWYKSAKRLKFEQEEKERQAQQTTTSETIHPVLYGNGGIKVGDNFIKDQAQPSNAANNQVQGNNFVNGQVGSSDKNLGYLGVDSTSSSNTQQNFGDLKTAEDDKDKQSEKEKNYEKLNNYLQEILDKTNVDDGMSVRESADMLIRNFTDEFFAQILQENNQPATPENIEKIKNTLREQMAFDSRGSDGIVVTGSVGVAKKGSLAAGVGGGVIYSLMLQRTYPLIQAGTSGLGSALNGQILSMRIVSLYNDIDLKDANVMHDIFSGISIGATVSYGIGGGTMVVGNKDYRGKVIVLLIGVGTPSVDLAASVSELLEEHSQRKSDNLLSRDIFGQPD